MFRETDLVFITYSLIYFMFWVTWKCVQTLYFKNLNCWLKTCFLSFFFNFKIFFQLLVLFFILNFQSITCRFLCLQSLVSYSYFLFFHSRKMKKWRHVKFDVVVTLFRCLKHGILVDFIMGNKIHNDVIVSFYHSCFLLKWFLDNIYYLKFSLLKLFKLGTNMELNQILDQHILLK